MKKLRYLIFIFVMLIPIYVNALDLSSLPFEIQTNEGIVFNYIDDEYVAYCYDSTTTDLNIITDGITNFDIIGSKNIILNSNTTIQNLKFISKEGINESATIPFVVHKLADGNQSIVLSNLEVVGYDLKYDSNKNDFTVKVPNNINKVYVNAVKEGNFTTVTGDGLVELNENKTKVEITVSNLTLGTNVYTVTIVKENKLLNTFIIMIIIFAALVVILLFIFKKYQDKILKIDPNILKSKVKEINVEEIIKQNAETTKENTNNISNETITPGILTPRTLIPEEDKK